MSVWRYSVFQVVVDAHLPSKALEKVTDFIKIARLSKHGKSKKRQICAFQNLLSGAEEHTWHNSTRHHTTAATSDWPYHCNRELMMHWGEIPPRKKAMTITEGQTFNVSLYPQCKLMVQNQNNSNFIKFHLWCW